MSSQVFIAQTYHAEVISAFWAHVRLNFAEKTRRLGLTWIVGAGLTLCALGDDAACYSGNISRNTESVTYHRRQRKYLYCNYVDSIYIYMKLCDKFAGPQEALDQSPCSHGRNAPKEGRREHMTTDWKANTVDCCQTANSLRIATLWDIYWGSADAVSQAKNAWDTRLLSDGRSVGDNTLAICLPY